MLSALLTLLKKKMCDLAGFLTLCTLFSITARENFGVTSPDTPLTSACTVRSINTSFNPPYARENASSVSANQVSIVQKARTGWAGPSRRNTSHRDNLPSRAQRTASIQAHLASVQSMVWTYPLPPVKSGGAIGVAKVLSS